MRRHRTLSLLTIPILLGVNAAYAHGPVECPAVPQTEWKPQMELQAKLKSEGWKVRQVKTYHNCYEVYGTDDKGERVEAFFHPTTFARVTDEEIKDAAKKKP